MSGADDGPIRIIPGGVLCPRGRPINIGFLIDKDLFNQLARGDTRIRLIELGSGRVMREEKVDLNAADLEERDGKFDIWVADVLKAPPISFQEIPVNRDPLPTGEFCLQLVEIRGKESVTVGKSATIEIVVALTGY